MFDHMIGMQDLKSKISRRDSMDTIFKAHGIIVPFQFKSFQTSFLPVALLLFHPLLF